MRGKFEAVGPASGRRQQSRGTDTGTLIISVVAVVLVVMAAAMMGWLWMADENPVQLSEPSSSQQTPPTDTEPEPSQTETDPSYTEPEPTQTDPEPTETEPEAVRVVSTATITSTGDLLMHKPVLEACKQEDGSYDFDSVFRYVSPYVSVADYAVANLKTTLAGDEGRYPYSGSPNFNSPDSLVEDAAEAGFDMLTTANNLCYDTGTTGLIRTVQVIEEHGLAALGTTATAEDQKYRVVELNGIRVGMVSYTFATTTYTGRPAIKGIPVTEDGTGLINTFDYSRLDAFYAEMEGHISGMKEAGADAVILYIQWGYEFQLSPHAQQKTIAQKMCDLGVDVIVGCHPCTVQPMQLLTSSADPDHKTVCLYSTGNAVSNQRLGNIQIVPTAHTEDGVLFSVTFVKYSDGTVALEMVELLPCWVNMHKDGGKTQYNILPLDPETRDQWNTLYSLTDKDYKAAEASYERTMEQVGEGLEECQTYLAEAKAQREADYQAAAENG